MQQGQKQDWFGVDVDVNMKTQVSIVQIVYLIILTFYPLRNLTELSFQIVSFHGHKDIAEYLLKVNVDIKPQDKIWHL